ncbi:MAG: methyltransferase domain-containing protein [Streptosporangiales bacterium]|nr:methyltransferase domain-containing protein [Streptosporangiales bacterium]
MDRGGLAERRRELLAGLCGRVIEVGAGDGLNFAYYPEQVTAVLAVEPEPYLREIAWRNAERAAVPIEVVDGLADELPAADGAFDAAVASQLLCSVPDQHAALGEVHRVVRAGGQLRFLEHVRAGTPGLRRVQRVVDATVWPILFGGCHTGRDTVAAIEKAGFAIERLDLPDLPIPAPASPYVLGTAHRP